MQCEAKELVPFKPVHIWVYVLQIKRGSFLFMKLPPFAVGTITLLRVSYTKQHLTL